MNSKEVQPTIVFIRQFSLSTFLDGSCTERLGLFSRPEPPRGCVNGGSGWRLCTTTTPGSYEPTGSRHDDDARAQGKSPDRRLLPASTRTGCRRDGRVRDVFPIDLDRSIRASASSIKSLTTQPNPTQPDRGSPLPEAAANTRLRCSMSRRETSNQAPNPSTIYRESVGTPQAMRWSPIPIARIESASLIPLTVRCNTRHLARDG